MKNLGIFSIIIIILFVIGINLFSDPLDELTRGCSCNDSYSKDYKGYKSWNYHCKGKPWTSVHKYLYEDSKYPNYAVYIKEGVVGSYIWYSGEYHCEIYSSYYVHQGDKCHIIFPGQNYRIYDDCCTKQEFVNRLKETIASIKAGAK